MESMAREITVRAERTGKLDLPEAASTSAKGGGRFLATGSGAIRRD